MPTVVDWLLAFAAQGIPLGCAALVLLALARRLRRRYGARWLCRVWLVLAALLLLPLRLAVPALSPARVTLPAWTATDFRLETGGALLAAQQGAAAGGTAGQGAADAAGHAAVLAISPLELLAAVWLAGAAAVLLWQGAAYLVWRRRAVGRGVPAGEDWRQALQDAMNLHPMHRPPRLLASAAVRAPVTAGVLRPVLLVPRGMAAPAGADLMLIHELTHLRRHDLAFKLLLTVVCGLHWYNPAVWLLARRAGRDIETACDEQVAAGRGSAFRAAYSDALLHAARMGRAPALTTGFALTRRDWADRLRQLWDLTPRRRGRGTLACLALAALAAGSLVACQTAGSADTGLAQAPEYPWTSTYSEVTAALDAAGAQYAGSADYIQLDSAELFGQTLQDVTLQFNSQGQLWGVMGTFPAGERAAVENAVTAALGEPQPEFIYITTFDALSVSAEYRAHQENLTNDYTTVWTGSLTLGEVMTEQQSQAFREGLRERYAESGAGFEGRTETVETADGGTGTVWYGEDAVDAILTNPATIVRCMTGEENGQLILEHTVNSMETINGA
ncbi:MAG TPA: M56 family metallopeptidase [Candidatus Gemmiger faecigallinarum]|nr:M56 family metallopeptidase [Candidatus Gemmiger faecigallinarum]